jgi:hypothetical protein
VADPLLAESLDQQLDGGPQVLDLFLLKQVSLRLSFLTPHGLIDDSSVIHKRTWTELRETLG